MPAERLQKIIAAAGVASRRKAEELITAGQVSVNGRMVTQLGAKADPDRDHIRVRGKLLRGPEHKLYFMLHKPKGYVTTVSDPQGRPTVMQLMRGVHARLFPVGRLDYLSEGLLLLTNDGELMQQLTRAATHLPKTYLVKVSGAPSAEAIAKLRSGVMIGGSADDGLPAVKAVKAQSLVRGHAEGRPEPPNPSHVSEGGTPRGENQARALRPAGTRSSVRRISPPHSRGSGALKDIQRQQILPSRPSLVIQRIADDKN